MERCFLRVVCSGRGMNLLAIIFTVVFSWTLGSVWAQDSPDRNSSANLAEVAEAAKRPSVSHPLSEIGPAGGAMNPSL